MRRLSDLRRVLGASLDYLRRHGTPVTPQEHSDHSCLGSTGLASFTEVRLSEWEGDGDCHRPGSLISNDSGALLDAARVGIGILARESG